MCVDTDKCILITLISLIQPLTDKESSKPSTALHFLYASDSCRTLVQYSSAVESFHPFFHFKTYNVDKPRQWCVCFQSIAALRKVL